MRFSIFYYSVLLVYGPRNLPARLDSDSGPSKSKPVAPQWGYTPRAVYYSRKAEYGDHPLTLVYKAISFSFEKISILAVFKILKNYPWEFLEIGFLNLR